MTLAEIKDFIRKTLPDRTKASDPMYAAGVVRLVLEKIVDFAGGWIVLENLLDTIARTGRTILGRAKADDTGALVQIEGYPSINSVLIDTTMLPGMATATARYDTAAIDFNTMTNAGVFRLDGTGWKAGGNTPAGVFTGVTTYGLLVVSKVRDGFVKQEYLGTDGTYYWRLSYPGSDFIAWQQPYRFTPGDLTTTGYLQTGKDNLPFKITTARAGANLSLRTDTYLEFVTPGGTYRIALIN